MTHKKEQNETEICQNYITPAIKAAGWTTPVQIRREFYFTDGAIQVRGPLASRGKKKFADYVLMYEANLPLAIVEAKDNTQAVGAGMQQALEYARILDIPFVFSSNGDAFLFHDRIAEADDIEVIVPLDKFPSPAELWNRYRAWKGLDDDATALARQPYYEDPQDNGKEPRYYQRIAVQRVIEAIAKGDRRLLVTMATGTGKTYTIFQMIWRLWTARRVKRVLFLVDRNVLADQTKRDDFKPFGAAMTKVTNRTIDKSYEVYIALYQAVTGTEEERNIYTQFSRDFFDLIVIDECHRGSAREDSAWRAILDYFKSAIQVGLTATPKETKDVSTLTYFGEPVYQYSLKEGIADGFLAPYKVVRVGLDRDLEGWTPTAGMRDALGKEIEQRVYNQRDMDRVLILRERTRRVAEKVIDYMLATDPYGKTIVFCEDIEHAERMRSALRNQISRRLPKERHNNRFVMRITGESNEGKAELSNFMDVESTFPVIATTSKLLTTGVNIKTLKLVVIDQRIQSMIEFKQIIGRGTRIEESAGKQWFTIIDFKKATQLFSDPRFDGEPEVIYEPKPDDPIVPPTAGPDEPSTPVGGPEPKPGKYDVAKVKVKVISEQVLYYGADGGLVTESITDYTRKQVTGAYATLSDFTRRWSQADRKALVIDELREQGVLLSALQEKVGADLDPFDLICHVVYGQPPLTRRERAEQVRKRDVFTQYGDAARSVLDALLDKYADEGIAPIEDMKVLYVQPFRQMGSPRQLVGHFGKRDDYLAAVRALEDALYDQPA